jgi:polyphosphate kinase
MDGMHDSGSLPHRDEAAPLRLIGDEAPPSRRASVGPPPDLERLDAPANFLGRDLSWLEFNRRVLAEAENPSVPPLERLKFLSIFSSNLDEFFMKRVALFKRRLKAGVDLPSHDGMTAVQVLHAARERVVEMQLRQAACYEQQVRPALAERGVRILGYREFSPEDRARLADWHRRNVFPVLTPLAVDPGHRFPFISNLSESLGVLVSAPGQGDKLFARLKVPDALPRLVSVPATGTIGTIADPNDIRFVLLEQVITNNLDDVFPGTQVVEVLPFRVTRSTGVESEGEDYEDLLEHVESALRMRRFAEPVRIEVGPDPSLAILDLLMEELELEEQDVYIRPGPLEYNDFFEAVGVNRPDLKDPPWRPIVPVRLRDEGRDIFSIIRERDVIVHHPYESFTDSVERFIEDAASDPQVLAIKQTLYRTSRDSPFIESLIRAAEEGKQVACLVELRARFDEGKNVQFARQLEKHGVHVAYGVVGLKTHCKCSLVVRREGDGLRSYAHLGTGNYHPGTAQLYTDFGLLTCDPDICDDVVTLFNHLTGRAFNLQYKRLIIAPQAMRQRFYELIDREIANAQAGRPARILAKMNQLEDRGIIERLYRASRAGVRINLVVRGFCCLRPGVPGLSENITVRGFIGRFLEHSRIFHFAAGEADPLDGEWYLSSADWMNRNLNDRVEVAAPVDDREARRRILRVLEANEADRRNAWELQPDGSYIDLQPEPGADAESPAALGTFETLCREMRAIGG